MAPDAAGACCGLGGFPGGGSHVGWILIGSALVVVLALFLYGKAFGLRTTVVRSVLSTAVLLACFYVPFFGPGRLEPSPDMLWLVFLLLLLGAYVLFFRWFHDGTVWQGVGFCFVAMVVYAAAVFVSFSVFEHVSGP